MIDNYDEFIEYVESVGVISFYGHFLDGFPKLESITRAEDWTTNEIEQNPWYWKDRVNEERKLVFGPILGGHKGFVSRKLFPLFYYAYRPQEDVAQLYDDGKISRIAFLIYELFNDREILTSTDIRHHVKAVCGEKDSKIDNALSLLQSYFYISSCGSKKRISSDGKEYGWPIITYSRTEKWIGDWIDISNIIPQKEARDKILQHCQVMSVDISKLRKKLFGAKFESI